MRVIVVQNCVVDLDPESCLSYLYLFQQSPSTTSINKCKLLHWLSNDEEPVAEGRWQTRDPKALVNGIPLGPNAIKVFVDVVNEPDTFLWRPTEEHSNLHDSLKTFVAWPVSRILFDDLNAEAPATASPRVQSQLLTPAAPVKSAKPVSQSPSGSSQQVFFRFLLPIISLVVEYDMTVCNDASIEHVILFKLCSRVLQNSLERKIRNANCSTLRD